MNKRFSPRMLFLLLFTAAYPFAVYYGLGHFEPRAMALLLIVPIALRGRYGLQTPLLKALTLVACVLALSAWLSNLSLPLKIYPIAVNFAMLGLFGWSLLHPPSAIEHIARLQEPDLPPEGVAYTRTVTKVWCGFFLFNGSIAWATAQWASDAQWAFYNGFVTYVLMGLLFGVEWLVRRRVRARNHG